jgi:hypothetical protein
MKQEDIAVKLYFAIQDGKQCSVEEQPITSIQGERMEYYVRIDGNKYRINKDMAISAIRHGAKHNRLERLYQFS